MSVFRAPRVSLPSIAIFTLVASFLQCAQEAPVRAVSAKAQTVRINEAEAPAGAVLVGPIAVTDGKGCGFGGERGTLAGATALMKQAAEQRGVGYVKLLAIKKPYSGHDCYHQEFKLSGLGYRLPGTVTREPAAPVARPPCRPPCSPGYACRHEICEPECNPPCAPGNVCRIDRVCAPG